MKWLFSLLIVLSVAVGLALLAYDDPGFVVISRGPWTVEGSLAVFSMLVLLSFILLYFLIRLWHGLWYLPERWQSRYQKKMRTRAQLALQQGFTELVEGQWKKAGRSFLRSQPQFLHYLGAAFASQRLGQINKRDKHLEKALEYSPSEYQLSVSLLQSQLQIEQQQYNLALATLKPLHEKMPQQVQVLGLLAQVYKHLGSWANLAALLPDLRKRKVLDAQQLQVLEIKAVQGILTEAAQQSLEALRLNWERLPKASRLQPAIAACYARKLLQEGQTEAVEGLLRDTLKQHWDKDLLSLYAHVNTNPTQQLSRAESWLKQHDQDPFLLLTLGQLSTRNRLWGKAQQYLEASLALEKLPETYQALGDLMLQMGETQRGADYYRQGLSLVNPTQSGSGLSAR
ncbi:heme biosynthesis HemY N-terminal domain-containing protein [Candidatus Venteria ishoeyi]|uniref:Putative protoheme IX biogenesis protein n=1 Tax=Candidatus Venteria ishoeyi TaxID=1899563 RepID=A0A1H6FDW1_9GAMM|nr:heme biosynthesis HemY N-terminal domain-containing protein [Candidatus Venteria ishoeyi]SEH07591.1 putative protoheme IX biogenesis protein [Candidatus Venteria ishoeyi]